MLKNFSEADSLKFSVLGQPVELTKTQASTSLKEIILEMKRIVKKITSEERKQLEKIMQAKSCQYRTHLRSFEPLLASVLTMVIMVHYK